MQLQSRDVGAGSKQRYATRASIGDPARRLTLGAGARGRAGDGGSAQGEAPASLRSKVLPGSEQFDAELYLGTIHAVSAGVGIFIYHMKGCR